jgi:GT2 family glycosyltransferase
MGDVMSNRLDLMIQYPRISVVIVNYNGLKHTVECLESLFNVDYPKDKLEIIVVDNGSTDGSLHVISSKFPEVKLIRLKKNYGFCIPNNIGAHIASGEYVFFLNNDTVVERSIFKELAKAIQKYDDTVVAFAPKILYYDNRKIINVAGATLSIIGFGFYIGDGEYDSGKYSKERYVGFGCGAAVLVRRDIFLRYGGFDSEYFASAEEAELGYKIWLAGKKVVYIPSARVYHKVSGTFGKRGPTPQKVYLQTRNRLLNMFKFIRSHRLPYGLILSLILDSERFLLYLIRKEKSNAFSVLYAYIDAFKKINKKSFKRKRAIWQSIAHKTKISEEYLIKIGAMSSETECLRREIYLWRLWKINFFRKKSR